MGVEGSDPSVLLLTSRQEVNGKAQNGLALVQLQLQIFTTVSTLFFKIPTSNEL